VVQARCPSPELITLLLEGRIGPAARAQVLRHAADCVSCRRHLAIASLPTMGPLRAWIEARVTSDRLTAAAGLIAGIVVVWAILPGSAGSDAMPPSASGKRPRPTAGIRRDREVLRTTSAPGGRGPDTSVPSERPESDPPSGAPESSSTPAEPQPTALSDPSPEPNPGQPHRLESLVESRPPAVEAGPALPRAPEPAENLERLAILDPFGGLALEGTGGRSLVQGSGVIPIDARLTAPARTSGFHLGDGTKVQLTPGSAILLFQNVSRHCPGLAILQGSLLIESTHPQSLYLRRAESSGLIEGLDGAVYLGAGARGDALTVMPMGAKGLTWTRTGQTSVEIGASEALGFDGNGQELLPRSARAKISMARFVAWPEPSTLFFSTFEAGVQGMEAPGVVQGQSREGYIAAVSSSKGRKVIELSLPASLQNLPADATIRLRLRTTASRIQVGVGGNPSRTTPHPVPQRNRSETAWTSLSFAAASLDQDGLRDRGRGRAFPRGSLTFTVELPARMAAEDLVFDIDQIEIVKA
jgi:hypothetical protein